MGPSPSSSPKFLPTTTPLPSRRLPPPCWTDDETLALIDSYRDKWYALRRGNLRASHWQEVADAVAGRCRRIPTATSKTSVQCRHKIEKLRKRYRAEKQRSLSSTWVYFKNMEAMDHGPQIPTRPARAPSPPSSSSKDEPEPSSDPDSSYGNTRSLHGLMANGGGIGAGLRFTIPKAVRSKIDRPAPNPNPNPNPSLFKGNGLRSAAEEMTRRLERKRGKSSEENGAGEMVSALRMLGDGFMRMEQMKMEMAREMQKARMDMELQRTQMILESQRRIVDALVKGVSGSKKRAKVSPEA